MDIGAEVYYWGVRVIPDHFINSVARKFATDDDDEDILLSELVPAQYG